MTQTLEQRRAAHAWTQATDGVARYGSDYINDAKGLPALIMNSGLMQVMAFLEGKQGRHKLLGEHLRDWLHQSLGAEKKFKPFMQNLLEAEPDKFKAMTAEAFAWLRWLRQMAPAVDQSRGS